jgi:small subunit ribosomal protein S7
MRQYLKGEKRMPRKKTKSFKRNLDADLRYKNVLVTKLINKVMRDGKKRLAETLVYSALETAEAKAKQPAVEIFEAAIKNVAPAVDTHRMAEANKAFAHFARY